MKNKLLIAYTSPHLAKYPPNTKESAARGLVFWAIDRHSHSVSDTLYGVFPFWAPALLGLAWIADRTGGRPD